METLAFGVEHAEVYERTYRNRGKDWAHEARDVAARIRDLRPDARSLLDVGCGTGLHLEAFRTAFEHVEGLEIAPAMRERAKRRLPGVEIHDGDMRDFALGRTFDAVTSLFTPIGYAESVDEMRSAVGCMAAHLPIGGVLAIEPWWLAEVYLDGYVGSDLVRDDGRVIARVSHTQKVGRTAHMTEGWLVGDESGVREFTVTQSFTLFRRAEIEAAFAAAGCTVEYHEPWLTGRGLFVGVRRAS